MAPLLQQFQYAPLAEPPVIPPNPNSLGFHPSCPAQVPLRARGADYVPQQLVEAITFRQAITGNEKGLEQGGPTHHYRHFYTRAPEMRQQQSGASVLFVPPATVPELVASFHPATTRAAVAGAAHHAVGCFTFKAAVLGEEFGVVRERGPHWDAKDRYQRYVYPLTAQLQASTPFQFFGAAAAFETGAASFHVDRTTRAMLAPALHRVLSMPLQPITVPPQIAPSVNGTVVIFGYQFQYQPYAFAPFHQVATTIAGLFGPTLDDVRSARAARSRLVMTLPQAPSDTVVANIPIPGTATLIPTAAVGASELLPTMPTFAGSVSSEAFPTVAFGWLPRYESRVPLRAPQTRIDGLTFTNAGLIAPPLSWMAVAPETTRRRALGVPLHLSLARGEALEQLAPTLLWYPVAPDRTPRALPQTRIEGLALPLSGIAVVAPESSWQPQFDAMTRLARLPIAHIPWLARPEALEQLAPPLGWVGQYPETTSALRLLRAVYPDTEADHGFSGDVIPIHIAFLPIAPVRTTRRALDVAQQLAHATGVSHELLPVPGNAWAPQYPDTASRARWPSGLESLFTGQPLENLAPTLLWLPQLPDGTRRAVLPTSGHPAWAGIIVLSPNADVIILVAADDCFVLLPGDDIVVRIP